MKKFVWYKLWARKYAPYMASAYLLMYQTRRGFDFLKNKLFVPDGNLHAFYADKNEFAKLIKSANKFLLKQSVRRLSAQYENDFRRLRKFGLDLAKRDWSKLDDKKLVSVLRKITTRTRESGEVQFLSFIVLEGWGREVEKRYADKKEVLEWIGTPHRLTRLAKIRRELIQMVANGHISEQDLSEYVNKYSWIASYEIIDSPLAVSDLKQEIKQIVDVNREMALLELNQSNLNKYAKFIEGIKDKKWKKAVEIVHGFAFLKEMRDDYRREFYFCLRPFFIEVGKRLNMSLEQVNYLLSEEIEMALLAGGSAYKKLVKERQNKYSLFVDNGKLKIFSYDISKEFLEAGNKSDKEIKGDVASKGYVVGKVRIIYHRGEFSKFNKGEVLVTAMTHPEFMQIMKQAAAIVTDEGGITCHAAIISRELGIPCIIGTKIATQVLKDGDEVEVDAEKGLVRKL